MAVLAMSVAQTAGVAMTPDAVAACLLRTDELTARKLLEAVPGSDERAAAATKLRPAAERCGAEKPEALDRALGAVAERWYRKSRRGNDYRVLEVRQLVDPATFDEMARRSGSKMGAADALASCVVGRQAPEVQQLLDTAGGSLDEQGAFNALNPAMRRCIDAGAPARFVRDDLRAGLAREFYRSYVASIPKMLRMVDPALRRALQEQGLSK